MNESDDTPAETFEEFKNSFSYGSRTDLNFKFLKHLPEEEAAGFLQELFWKLGDYLDDGDAARLADHIRQGQVQVYDQPNPKYEYEAGFFASLKGQLAETKLALLASSGHFAAGHDPEPFGVKNMTQEQAAAQISDFLKNAPRLSEIPVDTPAADLRVRHGGYDIRGAAADHNVVFPTDHLRSLAREGRLNLHPTAYSFVGAASQRRLLRKIGPEWVGRFQNAGIEAMLLVPV